MRIAVPIDDNENIARHFGRTAGFIIFDVENNKIVSDNYRKNTFTGHARGLHHSNEHSHQHHHSHNGIFEALGDCNTVISGGMGKRLYDEFIQKDFSVYITSEKSIVKALKMFLNDKLDHHTDTCCNH